MSRATANTLPPCVIPPNPSPELRTVLAWVAGFNAWNVDLIGGQLSSERYEHRILPMSLKQPVRNKEEFLGYLGEMTRMFQEFKVTIHEIVESPGKIVLHASSRALSSTSHIYTNEYMLAITLASNPSSSSTPKIVAVKEFVDSHYALTFFPAERERMSQMAKTERSGGRK